MWLYSTTEYYLMSDGIFSKEILIANWLRGYLTLNNFSIIQLVTSGGQSHMSISYKDTQSNASRCCFPDLICYTNEKIIIGEIKPKFSYADKIKLLSIKDSNDGIHNIHNICMRRIPNFKIRPVQFVLIHGDYSRHADPEIDQLVLLSPQTAIELGAMNKA